MNTLQLEDSRVRAGVLAVGLCLGVFLIGQKLFVDPARSQLRSLRQELETEKRKSEILRRIVQLESTINGTRASLLEKRDAAPLIDAVNRLAEESTLTLVSVTPQPPQKQGQYDRLPIEVELQCTYHQLGRFLSRIESSKRFLRVDSVKMEERRDPSNAIPGLLVTLILSGYYHSP